jgi:hypothetical protein
MRINQSSETQIRLQHFSSSSQPHSLVGIDKLFATMRDAIITAGDVAPQIYKLEGGREPGGLTCRSE